VMNQSPFGQQNKGPGSQNFILAMVLSMAIIFGWQYFYGTPGFMRPAKPPAQTTQTTQVDGATVPAIPGATAVVDRAAALKISPRVAIDSKELSGSISLTGAQIDDLHLKNYREQADKTSPIITFLSPNNTQNGYFAEQGFVTVPGQSVKLPDSKTVWTAPAGAALTETTPLVLTWDNGEGLLFRRELSLSDDFLITVKQSVENKTSAAVSLLPYSRVQRQGTPAVAGYYSFFEGMLGWQSGKLVEIHYKDVAKENGKVENSTRGGWLGFTDKYWATSIIPDQTRNIKVTYQHLKQGERDAYQVDYLATEPVVIAAGSVGVSEDHLFAGAKIVKVVNSIGEKYKVDNFDYMIDWGWYWFLTKRMFQLMDFAKGLLGNFGLAILCVTVMVKLLVFPLANKSYASMSKMKKLQPEMERIKTEFPDDKVKQQQAIMEMYKKEKVNPVSGCLPVLVQIPIFFAIYKVILTSIELRHAPFYGWIHDLSAPDPTSLFNLFGLIPWTPPHILMLGIWPILMGMTMWVQMRLNPAPADPVQASLFNWMPLLFTFMLSSMPAGLVIYWTWSNLLSILQQSFIMKRNGTELDLFGNIRESIPFLRKKKEA
jgi:YidC/Oxa1 family membrane protein insertase